MSFSPSHNLLIVSDLHLGADLKRTGFAFLRGVATLDREFGRFLEWYAEHREGDRPWRLIVNGDMVDFINVTMLPAPEDVPGFEVTADERRFGLSGEEEKVSWMLGRIVDRHRPLFEKLAAFVAAGHELAIVRGNHDVEFHWPSVQERFKVLLAEIGPIDPEARESFLARISFLPWFYYEPGAIFVEHGHQYDEYSSFEYVLAPVSPEAPRLIDLPLSHYAIRYLANAFPNISTHDKDGWSFFDYLRMAWSGKSGNFLSLILGYVATVRRVAISVVRRKVRRARAARDAHGRALLRLAEQWCVPVDLLKRLERLHRGGALRSTFRAAQCYYADRFLLFGAFLGALFFFTGRLGVPFMGLGFGLTLATNRVLSKTRKSETPPKLKAAGRAVAILMNVPLVVMGHTHRAIEVVEPASPAHAEAPDISRSYINTGTWIPPAKDLPGFTHLMVRRAESGLLAELRRWDPPEARPRRVG